MTGATRIAAIGGLGICILWIAWSATADPADRSETHSSSADSLNAEPAESDASGDARFTTETLCGQVVWFAEAFEQNFDVRTTQDAKERVLALETESGELLPLVEDRRGRAFRKDERLRNRDVELFVRRYKGVPMLQIIRQYAVKPDGKYLVDYWCDICAISMVEDGPCDCCQAANVLRERKVE